MSYLAFGRGPRSSAQRSPEAVPQAPRSNEQQEGESVKETFDSIKNKAQDVYAGLTGLKERTNVDINDVSRFLDGKKLTVTGINTSKDWESFMAKRIKTDYALFASAIKGLERNFDTYSEGERLSRVNQLQTRLSRMLTDVENLENYFKKDTTQDTKQYVLSSVPVNNFEVPVAKKDVAEVSSEDIASNEKLEMSELFELATQTATALRKDLMFLNEQSNKESLLKFLGREKMVHFAQEIQKRQKEYEYAQRMYGIFSQIETLTPEQEAYMEELLNAVDARLLVTHEEVVRYVDIVNMPTVIGEYAFEVDKQRENFETTEKEYIRLASQINTLLRDDATRFAIQYRNPDLYQSLFTDAGDVRPNALFNLVNTSFQDTLRRVLAYDRLDAKDKKPEVDGDIAREMVEAVRAMENTTFPKMQALIDRLHEANRQQEEAMQSLLVDLTPDDYDENAVIDYKVEDTSLGRLGTIFNKEADGRMQSSAADRGIFPHVDWKKVKGDVGGSNTANNT